MIFVDGDIIIGTQYVKNILSHFVLQMARYLLRGPRSLWLLVCGLSAGETSVGPARDEEMDRGGCRAEVVA